MHVLQSSLGDVEHAAGARPSFSIEDGSSLPYRPYREPVSMSALANQPIGAPIASRVAMVIDLPQAP